MPPTPGAVLALVDHPNLDVVLLPVLAGLAGRGHRVQALVLAHGRAGRLLAAGVETSSDPAALDAFLAAPGPRLFLTAADQVPQHALGVRCVLLCRAAGVPSLAVQHSTFAIGRDIPYQAHLAFASDCMAVCGSDDARHYAALGLDPRRLVPTGAPAFDPLARARAQARAAGAPAGAGAVIFGQAQTWVGPRSTLGHDPEAWCGELARLYAVLHARFPGAPLRVKPHPAEEAHGLAGLWERAVPPALRGAVEVLPATSDNVELIQGSAFVASFSCSVWLEARCLDRCAAYFSLRGRDGAAGADLAALGGAWLPGRGLDLADRLAAALDDGRLRTDGPLPASDTVLERYVGPLDGGSTARVADLAEAMLAGGVPAVDLPELTFDGPDARPRLLRPGVSYAHYVHQQALADEVTAAGPEHPRVLELAPEGSDLVAHLPLAVHARRDGFLDGGAPAGVAAVEPVDVVVAPDLWRDGLPPDPAAEVAAMAALARRRVVLSIAAPAAGELHDAAAALLAAGDLDDAPPARSPDPGELAALCRATGLRVRRYGVHNGASYCQSLLLENLGLEPEALRAVRLSLQASGYPHEKGEGGARLVYVLEKPDGKAGTA